MDTENKAAQLERLRDLFPREQDIPPQHRVTPLDQRRWLCGGELLEWAGTIQEVFSPVQIRGPSGELVPFRLGSYPMLGEKESLLALEAARKAWDHGRGAWPTASVEERIRAVEDFVFRMQKERERVVRLLMWEIGKSEADSAKEFDRTLVYVRDTIAALKELDRSSSRFSIQEGVLGQIRRAPLGVVLCMGPFNYPLNETFTTLIPALIMGNPVIFKPPKLGVLLHEPLLEAFRASFPPGVVNTVYGDGSRIVGPLLSSGDIDVLAFIGSSRVADILKKQHPKPHRLRSVLGLDAKNAGIVLGDADLDLAVRECLLGSLSYNGQRCTALKILFVHRSQFDAFVEAFSNEVSKLVVGMPWQPGVQITPLPEPGKSEKMNELLEDALKSGARVVNPQGGISVGGLYLPAVLSPISPESRLYREEQFGPLVPILPFDDIEEPLDYVTSSDYGQQVSVFGRDPERVSALVDVLVNQVCRVNLNCQCQRGPDTFPFTGRKDSAEGTLSVSDALRVFSIRTLVAAKTTEPNQELVGEIVRERKSKFLSTDFIF